MIRFLCRATLLAWVYLLCAPQSLAQSVNVLQPIRFGSWLITNNAGAYSITINTDGSSSHSPQLVMIRPPQKGIYEFTGLPVSTTFNSLDVTQNQALSNGGGEVFIMKDFQVDAPTSTDASGHLPLVLGATVETSGNGGSYGNGEFTGQINVEINY